MTKGQFAMLAAALGLATMGGAGYIAYANTSPSSHGTASGDGATVSVQGGGSNQNGAGADVPSGGAGASGSADAVAQCVNGDVQVSQDGGQGAAGHISIVLVFQNTSGHRCSLYGFPGASLVGPDGKDLLDATRDRAGLSAIPTVVLDAGGQASAVLEWSDVTNSSEPGGCAVQKAANLMVTPPNFTQSTELTLGAGTEVCSGFAIHPVVKGVAGSLAG